MSFVIKNKPMNMLEVYTLGMWRNEKISERNKEKKKKNEWPKEWRSK